MMKTFAFTLLFAASSAAAQSSPIEPREIAPRPSLIASSPSSPSPTIDLRAGLVSACTQTIEGAALRNSGYLRGKDVVPDEAARYRQEVAGFVAFACPCVVETMGKQFSLESPTPETMEKVRVAIAPAMQRTCSKEVYVSQLKKGS